MLAETAPERVAFAVLPTLPQRKDPVVIETAEPPQVLAAVNDVALAQGSMTVAPAVRMVVTEVLNETTPPQMSTSPVWSAAAVEPPMVFTPLSPNATSFAAPSKTMSPEVA